MVILHAARHRLPVPPLARWMLALGILASLAVNVAQGWSHGLVGAVVAAWPAASLVGSYELLACIIRTAAPADRTACQLQATADRRRTSPVPACGRRLPEDGRADQGAGQGSSPAARLEPQVARIPWPVPRRTWHANQAGPDQAGPDRTSRADRTGTYRTTQAARTMTAASACALMPPTRPATSTLPQ